MFDNGEAELHHHQNQSCSRESEISLSPLCSFSMIIDNVWSEKSKSMFGGMKRSAARSQNLNENEKKMISLCCSAHCSIVFIIMRTNSTLLSHLNKVLNGSKEKENRNNRSDQQKYIGNFFSSNIQKHRSF